MIITVTTLFSHAYFCALNNLKNYKMTHLGSCNMTLVTYQIEKLRFQICNMTPIYRMLHFCSSFSNLAKSEFQHFDWFNLVKTQVFAKIDRSLWRIASYPNWKKKEQKNYILYSMCFFVRTKYKDSGEFSPNYRRFSRTLEILFALKKKHIL